MARLSKKQEVQPKNPGVFTEEEALSFYTILFQELKLKAKGCLPDAEIAELAKSHINKDEETNTWLRKNGVLQMVTVLSKRHFKVA